MDGEEFYSRVSFSIFYKDNIQIKKNEITVYNITPGTYKKGRAFAPSFLVYLLNAEANDER